MDISRKWFGAVTIAVFGAGITIGVVGATHHMSFIQAGIFLAIVAVGLVTYRDPKAPPSDMGSWLRDTRNRRDVESLTVMSTDPATAREAMRQSPEWRALLSGDD